MGEREQPCYSPTLTLKGFVVALLTRTQTLECMYSDLMAVSNWPMSQNRKWYHFADRTIDKNCKTNRR